MGRFLTPDPYKAGHGSGDPANPQSWNRYAYSGGDPINGNDSQGLETCKLNGEEDYQPACMGVRNPGGGNNPYIAGTIAEFCDEHPEQCVEKYLGKFIAPAGNTITNPSGSRYVNNLITSLEGKLDSDCLSWLEMSGVASTGGQLYNWLESARGRVGVGAFTVTSTGEPSGTIAQAGLSIGNLNIIINTNGGFFKGAGASGIGNLNFGTQRLQIFTLIHEFAHELGIPGFIPEGSPNQGITDAREKVNNDKIFQNCDKTLSQFAN